MHIRIPKFEMLMRTWILSMPFNSPRPREFMEPKVTCSDIIKKILLIMLRGEVCLEISECFVTFSEWRPGPGTA